MRRWVAGGCALLVGGVLGLPSMAVGTTYAVVVGTLWAGQEKLLFPARSTKREVMTAQAQAWGAREVDLVASDGTRLYGWHVDRGGERLLLYLHGNAGGVTAAAWLADQLPGVDVLTVSYRGYPASEGRPSQEGLTLDAQAAWDFVVTDLGVPPERVVVHGRSLGGGVAMQLLRGVEPGGVVLESTFTALAPVAARQLPGVPVGWLLRHPFRSERVAPRVRSPALVIHGTQDGLVPFAHGEALAAALPRADLVAVEGHGHDWLLDDPQARAAWQAFVWGATATDDGAPPSAD